MTTIGWVQILIFCAIIVAITPVLGAYMTRFHDALARDFCAHVLVGQPVRRNMRFALIGPLCFV